MFGFLKKNEDKVEEDLYFKNIKEASLFLDKAILTLSSVFLGFLFSQLKGLLELNLINIEYLIISYKYRIFNYINYIYMNNNLFSITFIYFNYSSS